MVGNPTGISIAADGTLSVLKNAQSGTVTVRATSKKTMLYIQILMYQ